MDFVSWKENFVPFSKKYRYLLLAIGLGIAMLLLPEPAKAEPTPQTVQAAAQQDLQMELSQILSRIEGAGTVSVLLAPAKGEETLYQLNEDLDTQADGRAVRRDTVIVNGENRMETGLIRQINPPSYQGAIVACQGADSPKIRLAIAQAVASVTGLGTDRITVLKLK